MQATLHWLGLALGLWLFACCVRPASATRQPEVVRVGEFRLDVPEIQQRMSFLPEYQLLALGDSPAAIRSHFVQQFLVRDLLLDARAQKLKLESDASLRPRVLLALAQAQERELRKEAAELSAEDVQRYYERHRSDFEVPRRIWLWRILLDSAEAAQGMITELGEKAGPPRFRELARERSLDKATGMRGGDLGWVRENGETDVPQVRVDPALFEAARKLEDGEIAPAPVPEGEHFAVVWRRGTLAQSARSLSEAEPEIVRLLTRQRSLRARVELVQRLRREELKDHRPELIDRLPARLFEEAAAPAPTARPEPSAPGRDPKPQPTDRGLR